LRKPKTYRYRAIEGPIRRWPVSGDFIRRITDNQNFVFKRLNGQSVFIMSSWKESSAIIQGLNVWNTLRVDCADNQMKFYINDTLVETLTDNSFSSGKVGLRAYDAPQGNLMEFDNVNLMDKSLW
jgi:hypothetical protein